MRQSKKTYKRDEAAALYVRLSRDDNLEGDSYSISNQKKLLTKVAKEKGYTKLYIYCDDGISGVTMDRPGFADMLSDIKNFKVSAVFVKDLSRLGRNYIEVGKLTEEFFPEHDIRLVAVSDGIDTEEGENDIAPIKNLFNEWYSRDISKKRRISNKIKGNSGEPLGQPPYGYIQDPDDHKRWIIDDEAAAVVQRIYSMTLSGFGAEQIAGALEKDKILTPMNYWLSKGRKRAGRINTAEPYKWNNSTITKILHTQEYCGDLINFKTYSKSYKNKKRIENDKENWVIFKDVHEPIIERSVWEKIQAKCGKTRKRKKADGEKNMFSGLLVCADCGSNLWYHFNQKNPSIEYFNCSGYNRGSRKICQSTHYIRVDFLEKAVLGEIRRLTKLAVKYEGEFMKLVMGQSIKDAEHKIEAKQSELKALLARDKELDILFERIYEDNVMGRITDERFGKLSVKYDAEQKELSKRIESLKSEIAKSESRSISTDEFMSVVRKYTRARKLTPRMLNELIEKIEVYQAEIIDGKKVQRLKIHYNCIGSIEIPKLKAIPENEIKMNTRKGVDIYFSENNKKTG